MRFTKLTLFVFMCIDLICNVSSYIHVFSCLFFFVALLWAPGIIFINCFRAVKCVDFTSDGLKIVSGSDDTSTKLWDIATGESITELRGHTV